MVLKLALAVVREVFDSCKMATLEFSLPTFYCVYLRKRGWLWLFADDFFSNVIWVRIFLVPRAVPGRSSSAGTELLIYLLTCAAVGSEVCAWDDGFDAN